MAVLKIYNGSSFVDIANFDSVPNSLFDANTILVADTDDTPAALTIDEDTILGRITSGNIKAIKGPEVSEVLSGDSYNTWTSNVWYHQSPGEDPDISSTGVVLVADTVYYTPLWISHRVTFDNFGFHVATAEAGKNARIAIYDASGNEPTTLVVESGNITLASTGASSVAVTQTTLQAGQYFWASNADSSTAAVRRIVTSESRRVQSLGAGTVGGSPKCLYTEASAFGVFPATATPGSAAAATSIPAARLQVV